MSAFWVSLAGVFGLEMGDKTQLVALCLASRYNTRVTLAGIFSATLVVHVFSVLLGGGVGKLMPPEWVQFAAGLAFIGFGLWTLRGDSLEEDECKNIQSRSPFWLIFTTFFLAELGDKTMLGTVAFAADRPLIPVWLGSSMGMVIADGLAIMVGQLMGRHLPERPIKIGAGVIFLGFGIFKTVQGALVIGSYSWALAGLITAVLAVFFLRGGGPDKVESREEEDDNTPALHV
ncbi:TMEM165/GDT1 family protein [bacterium]|nr:TMEM165/GDT1 family protein [bacterium]